MTYDLRVKFPDDLPRSDPELESVSQRFMIHERQGLSQFSRYLHQDSSDSCIKQELRSLEQEFRSWLQPEKNSKDEMISLLVLEQFLINRHASDRQILKEKWNSCGKNMEKFLEDLSYASLKKPALLHVSMQEQEALFTENMSLSEAVSLLRKQSLEGTLTKENMRSHYQEASLETALREVISLAICEVQESDVGGSSETPSQLIQKENYPKLEESDVSLEENSNSRMDVDNASSQEEPTDQVQPVLKTEPEDAPGSSSSQDAPGSSSSQDAPGSSSSQDAPGSSSLQDAPGSSSSQDAPGSSSSQDAPGSSSSQDAPGSSSSQDAPGSSSSQAAASTADKLRPYKCELCPKAFRFRSRLNIHMKRHNNQRSYFCKYCQKGFYQSSELREHERIHTGERPFSCAACGFSFTHRTNFRAHERIHTGSKPFVCPYCKRAYRQSSTYHRHLKVHEKRGSLQGGDAGDEA